MANIWAGAEAFAAREIRSFSAAGSVHASRATWKQQTNQFNTPTLIAAAIVTRRCLSFTCIPYQIPAAYQLDIINHINNNDAGNHYNETDNNIFIIIYKNQPLIEL